MEALDLNPFFFEGGEVGCLLVHGFSGSPPEMQPMGDYLAGKGLTVLGVRLAGHGTSPEDMATTTLARLGGLGRGRTAGAGGPLRAGLRGRPVHGAG